MDSFYLPSAPVAPKPKSDAWLLVVIVALLGVLFSVIYLQGVKDGKTTLLLDGYRKVATAEAR